MTQPRVGNEIRIFTDGLRPKQAYVDLVLDRDEQPILKEFATMPALLRSLRFVSALGTSLALFAAVATLAAVTAVAAHADSGAPSWGPATPNFNLQVILRPVEGTTDTGFGLVKFRQPKDAEKVVYLDVWVRDLVPNHSYLLQRAVDTNVNDDCSGTNWLTLGQGLVPQAITTDETGTGRANLFRSLASIPLGTEFDIHFRVIDAVTSAVVLESGCYQYTVSQ